MGWELRAGFSPQFPSCSKEAQAGLYISSLSVSRDNKAPLVGGGEVQ